MFRHPQSVGSRDSDRLGGHGLSGAGHDQRGCLLCAGLPDTPTALGVDGALRNIADIVGAVELPVNADFQAGYANDLDGLAANVRRCVATGVAGLSIEDARGGAEDPLYSLPEAVERIRVAHSAIDGADVLLTARAECFLYDHPDPLREAIARLQAFSEAGADVLYAPGVRTREDIAAIVDALRPAPVNVLMSSDTGLTVDDLAELGVRRISVGSALTRVAWGAFLSAARRIVDDGSFAGLSDSASFDELNGLFEAQRRR